MNTISVTGASGFVGKNLLSYLAAHQIKVKIISRADLHGELKFINEDAIIHLAGKAHDLKKSANPKEYDEVNYELTKSLYDAFLNSTAKKFIFMSSVKAVADTVYGVLEEDVQPDPKTDYGKSKLKAEQYIQSQPLPSGKSFYILRPCMIHGPGNKGNLNLLYKFVQKRIPYPLAAFENKRSFLSVENLCFVIHKIISSDSLMSGVYQVADDEPLSTNQVIAILAETQTSKPKLWYVNPKLIKLVAKIGDRLKLPLTTERLIKLTESYVVSNVKIKQELNITLPLTSKEGLKLTANSFRKKTSF